MLSVRPCCGPVGTEVGDVRRTFYGPLVSGRRIFG